MIKLSNLIKEIKVNKPGSSKVYVGEPIGNLFKVENFPAISNINYNPFERKDAGYYLKDKTNPRFAEIIKKLINYTQGQNNPSFTFKGDFSSSNSIVYIFNEGVNRFGENMYYIVNSMEFFAQGYQTEEAWGIENWKEI
jgi:hypothetical protein